MGLLDRLLRKKEVFTPIPDSGEDSRMIQLLDASGTVINVPREDYRTKMLPGILSAAMKDADTLYAIVVGTLRDGFFPDVLTAAEHLYRIDPKPSRSVCAYGIALMKNGRNEDAERVFLSHIAEHGEEGAVLTNLAKIYAERNEFDKSRLTLWRALEVDPNTENALTWFAASAHERSGQKGMEDAWERVAAIPGSWRAQLWLAQRALETHDREAALTSYRQSLARVGDDVPTDFLMQMSGDLGKHGLLAELLELAEPPFVPAIHGLQVGNNLIRANVSLGRINRARGILNQLRMIQRLDWKTHLDFWESELEKQAR